MKIDNKGWGLNTTILMVVIILMFLLVATFFAIRFNALMGNNNNEDENKLQQVVNQTYYINQTNSMTIAAEKFINNENIELTREPMKIGMTLIASNGYMEYITDYISNNKCLGYSIAYLDSSDIKIIRSYIKCDNYESKGYGDY